MSASEAAEEENKGDLFQCNGEEDDAEGGSSGKQGWQLDPMLR